MAAPLTASILEAAVTWHVDLRNTDSDDPLREAHRQWLAQHPAHRLAWERVEKLQQILGSLPVSVARPALAGSRLSRRQINKTLSLLLVAGVGAAAWRQRDIVQAAVAAYRTGIGETIDAQLADGSRLQLDTASAVDVRYGHSLREILLHRGEILITTAPDAAARPFIVHTRHGSIRALGTRFLVRSESGESHVGVFQHAVEIRRLAAVAQPIRLETGQQMRFSDARMERAEPLAADADAWTQGLLVVSDWRLDRFLAELSRYRRGSLGCDAAVAGLRISGAFHLHDTGAVLENLAATLPVEVRYLSRYWVRVGPR